MVSKFYNIVGNIILFIGVIVAFFCWFWLVGEGILETPLAIFSSIGIFLIFLFSAMIFFAIGYALQYLQRSAESTEKILAELLKRQ